MHFDANETGATIFLDDENNKTSFEANVKANAYTAVKSEDISNVQALLNSINGNVGFDISGKYQYDIFRFLTVGAQARIPLAPSKMNVGYKIDYNIEKEFSFDELLGGSSDSDEEEDTTEVPKLEEEEETEDNGILGAPIIGSFSTLRAVIGMGGATLSGTTLEIDGQTSVVLGK